MNICIINVTRNTELLPSQQISNMFSWQLSGEFIVFIIIGGVGRLFGPVVGALVFVGLEHFLGGVSDFWHIYLGVILLLIVLFSKSGLIGLIAKKRGAS